MLDKDNHRRNNIQLLLDRLERLSADSKWAHRASGLRGSLIRALSVQNELGLGSSESELEDLIDLGFSILAAAAARIPDYNTEK